MKSWVQDNDKEMYSISNEEKFVVAERFIRTLKSKTCKYMTLVWKIMYIDKLTDIVNKYNNKYYSTIEIKPVGVNPIIYTDLVTI